MKKINEIFCSLQGEGARQGTANVFIRFADCNLKCPFCDTEHKKFKFMSDAQIIEQIKKYNVPNVILTGGEPTLQIDKKFIDLLHNNGFYVAIETNGTKHVPNNVDYIAVSPKGRIAQNFADEIKILVSHETEDKTILDTEKNINYNYKFVQPIENISDNEETQRNIIRCVNFVKQHPDWRLSLQIHKYIAIK